MGRPRTRLHVRAVRCSYGGSRKGRMCAIRPFIFTLRTGVQRLRPGMIRGSCYAEPPLVLVGVAGVGAVSLKGHPPVRCPRVVSFITCVAV